MLDFLKGRQLAVRIMLLASALLLTAIGIITIYSVGYPEQSESSKELADLWQKQLFFAAVGLGTIVLVNLVSYRRLGEAGYWIFAAVLVMLVVLLIDKFVNLPFVPVINGARRWIRIPIGLGSLNIQPSEVCKPAYVLALAWYLRYKSNYRNFRSLIGPFYF
jgi:cell division protein FtsW (lipid II flippase)